jgi:hypothetical protein
MKFKMINAVLLLLILVLGLAAGCGKKNEPSTSAGSTGVPVDIIKHVSEDAVSQPETSEMSDRQKEDYQIILDGWAEEEAGYYLYDVTGNGKPELIVGGRTMTVYSYQQDQVVTVGSIMADDVYLSAQYGFLTECLDEPNDELRLYTYDGTVLNEKVVLHTDNRDDYNNLVKTYKKDAKKLKRWQLSDRSSFE